MLKNMFIESMNQPITNWLNLNYTASKDGSIPRCAIYQHYCEDFKKEGIEPLNTAMFGKVIKMAFPFIRSRRLGNRGNSKYHYFGVTGRDGFAAAVPLEESVSEKAFIQKYNNMQAVAVAHLVESEYVKAYQELKRFWTEHMAGFVSTKNLERLCLGVEKTMFGSLVNKIFPASSLTNFSEAAIVGKVSRVKTAAKTVSVLCRQLLTITNNKGIAARLECYKTQSIILNRVGNMYRCASILETRHSAREELHGFITLMGSGLYVLQSSIALDKSHTIHGCVMSLVSYFIATRSFAEFILEIDSVAAALLAQKEKVLHEELHAYFSGVIQEVLCSGFSSAELASVLCTFFAEYFSILSTSTAQEPLFKKPLVAPALPDPALSPSDQKSFVSQIICSTSK